MTDRRVFREAVAVGIGFRPGTGADRILSAVRAVLADADCRCLATLDRRGDEPGLLCAAAELRVPVRTFSAAELAGVEVPHPSECVAAATGTASVAEAAAVLAARGGPLVHAKTVHEGVTVALAQVSG
ncbi:cobalamin biosynthesis protein [Nocardia higoensis]|uniref:cobalamin biosynthesis protein n=1 Tax=Nocardia higoensis TaxID=228599 RepID=UPI00030B46AE|nr:cobalamin biosynthesis protein [Nocardia higoensis]